MNDLTVLVPTTVHPPSPAPDGVTFVPFDPTRPIPDELLHAEVLVGWGSSDAQLGDAARRMPRLRLVQLFSAGSDGALKAGFAPGVTIASGRGLHDRPVAEHALMLTLAAARRLHLAFAAAQERRWDADLGGIQPEPSPGLFSTLRGAQVTIWGFGSIGSTLAPHLVSLGAEVVGVGRSARREGDITVIAEADVEDRLARTDAVIMILPSTPQTRHSLNAARLATLPRHAWVINVGRGDTVEEPALIAALHAGRLAGAALDVTADEPLPPDSPLWSAPNLILTPHAAGGRPLGGVDLLLQNLVALRQGTTIRNEVTREHG